MTGLPGFSQANTTYPNHLQLFTLPNSDTDYENKKRLYIRCIQSMGNVAGDGQINTRRTIQNNYSPRQWLYRAIHMDCTPGKRQLKSYKQETIAKQ